MTKKTRNLILALAVLLLLCVLAFRQDGGRLAAVCPHSMGALL